MLREGKAHLLLWFYSGFKPLNSHLGHQLESHRLERLVLGHNGYGRGIGGVVAKLKVHAGGRGAHKVAAILRQAQDLFLDLGLIGMSNPGAAPLPTPPCPLMKASCSLLNESRMVWNEREFSPLSTDSETGGAKSTHIILDCFLDFAASLADGRWQEGSKVFGLLCYFRGNCRGWIQYIVIG